MKKKKMSSESLWQMMKGTKIPYEDISLDSLEKGIRDFLKGKEDDCFVRELSSREIANTRYMLGGMIDTLGERLFRLPGGAITGIGGVEMFNKTFEEQAKKFIA